MKYIFLFVLFLSLLRCNLTSSHKGDLSCSDARDEFNLQSEFPGAKDLSEAWQWFLNSNKVLDGVTDISWHWTELGPTKTPEEGQESKALKNSYRGRGNGTGRVNNIVINPQFENQVFACSPSGGLFCSRDSGQTWSNAGTDKMLISAVSSISINPLDSANWLITSGDGDDDFIFSNGIFRTFDSGKNWEQINGNLDFKLPIESYPFGVYLSKVVAHPCDFNKQFLATNKGLFKSGNVLSEKKKVKWKRVSAEEYYDVEISPLNESIVLAGGQNLQLSNNCGKSFKRILRPKLEGEEKYGLVRMSIEFSREDREKAFVAICRKRALGSGGAGEGFLFEFNLVTHDWKKIRSLKRVGNLIPSRGRAFEFSPDSDSLLLIGNVKPVYRSKDAGETFEKIAPNQMHDDIHDFEFFSNGTTVLAGHDGGVSISYDSGNTWKPWDDGIGVANVHGLAVSQTIDPIILYGAYDCGTTLFSNNQWKHVAFGDGFEAVIDYTDVNKMILTMQNGSMYGSKNGAEFEEYMRAKGVKSSWHTWIKQNPIIPNIVYSSGSHIGRSMDFGQKWKVICEPKVHFENNEKPWRFYQDHNHAGSMFVIALGKQRDQDYIYFSNNVNDTLEVSWKKIKKIPKSAWVSSVMSSSECETCHFLTFNTFDSKEKVFYFNGDTYKEIKTNIGRASIRSGVIDKRNGTIYLGTRVGVFVKHKDKTEWKLLSGLPGVRIRSMEINYVTNEVFLGTFGRGIWKGPLDLAQ